MNTDSAIAYIKTEDPSKDVKTRPDPSNYKLDRPLSEGKMKKLLD